MKKSLLMYAFTLLVLGAAGRPAEASCGNWPGGDNYTMTLSAVPGSVSVAAIVRLTIHNPQTGGPAGSYTFVLDGDTPVPVSNQCPTKFAHDRPGPICQDGPYVINEGETDVYLVAVPAGTTRTITVRFIHPTHGGVIEADIAYADPAGPGPVPQVRTHHVLQRIGCL